MTVCIGALCADLDGQAARAVVVASDRMVTQGGITEFEHDTPKITAVAEKMIAAASGDALRASRLAREIRAAVPSGSVTVDQVAQATAVRYAEHRRAAIQADIFTPRGISMEVFYLQGLQQRMLPAVAGMIDQQVMGYNFGVDLILVGVDEAGAHLYSVSNPGGSVRDFESIGFQAVGSGSLHALQSMIGFGHSGGHGLNETVFSVYASKRRAEKAPGVGKETDLLIITAEGVTTLEHDMLEQLDHLYAEYQRPVDESLKTKMAKLHLLGGTK